MKTDEEIDELAEKEFPTVMWQNSAWACAVRDKQDGFKKGYSKCQEESGSDLHDKLIKTKAVIEYCYDHLDTMWAAKITGMLLGCDFRDAKEHADIFFEFCDKEGL